MKNLSKLAAIVVINLLVFTNANLYSQTIDSSFGQNGILISSADTLGGKKDYRDLIVLKDRRLLALYLELLYNSGQIVWGGNFAELLNDQGQRVTPAGRIPVTSLLIRRMDYKFLLHRDGYLYRYSFSAAIDASFGNNGSVNLYTLKPFSNILNVEVTPENKIAVVASGFGGQIIVFRLNSNGSPDQSFGTAGVLVINATDNPFGISLFYSGASIGFQPNGVTTLLLEGQASSVSRSLFVRINVNGTIDRTYGNNGWVAIGQSGPPALYAVPKQFVVQPDGNIFAIILVKSSLPEPLLPHVYRVLNNGVWDTGFDIPLPGYTTLLKQRGNGKLLVGGYLTSPDHKFIVGQLNANGTIDNSFGTNGIFELDAAPGLQERLNELEIDGNRLYLIGTSEEGGPQKGVIARCLLDGETSPAVTITSPITGTVIPAGTPITLQTSLAPVTGGWAKVEFLNQGQVFATINTAPYNLYSPGVEPGDYWVAARGISNNGDTIESYSVNITVTGCDGSGSISAEGYPGISGSAVVDLTNHLTFPNDPSVTTSINSFEFSNTQTDSFGARLRGYICVPANGLYSFNIASNDQSELWLSTDANPANRQRIAWVNTAVSFREWDKYASQKSAPLNLIKGVKYYIEALYKENIGDDHLSVAWTLGNGSFEGPIPGSRLIPFITDSVTTGKALIFKNFTPESIITGGNIRTAKQQTISNANGKNFTLYASPNPTSNYFTISVRSESNSPVNVAVFDIMGRKIETKLNVTANVQVTIGHKLQAGIYFLEVIQDGKKERLKLIKH